MDAFALAAETPGQEPGAIYNVGTGTQTTLADLVAVVRRELCVDAVPRWESMSDRTWDTEVWVADPALIQARLGWQPRHDVADGFRRLVSWFQRHPAVLECYARRQTAGS